MNKFFIANAFALLLVAITGWSCSEEDYNSYPPEFSDIIFTTADGSENLTTDTPIEVTLIQSKKGKLLDRTSYKWESEDGVSIATPSVEVVYDKENTNPSVSLVCTSSGSYKLKFTARYSISGQVVPTNYTKNIPQGKVTCTSSTLYYDVVVEKNFKVK